jgi:hypothetical protein
MAARKPRAAAPDEAPKEPSGHELDRGEEVIGEAVREGRRIAVTDVGRKVVLSDDGHVIERLVGPLYSWEME